ncbi:aminotransferase-like domain-containing protein [Rheinheimera tilapiae]|uniref:PLP-dependent aminotransferase family protein n=1 Tax=Rheinheimera tilapiae TaxID=875043 RepID=A0ABV6BCB3_9GAMM
MQVALKDFQLDLASAQGLTTQLLQQSRQQVQQGSWPAGARLPSVRALASHLGISKFTVADVYERLNAEGLVLSRPGSGVFVARRHPALQLQENNSPSELADEVALMRQTLQREPHWLKPAAGWLTPDYLPQQEIRAALKEIARQEQALTDYGPAQGYLPLRQYLVNRLAELRIQLAPQQILLTQSATHALDLVLRLLIKPGDKIIVDDPGFYNFQAMLRLHQLELLYLPRTADGPDLQILNALLDNHKVRAYLTNSVLSNPVGTCVTPPKAVQVLSLLKQHQVLLIEDDIYADFEAQPALRYASLTGLQEGIYLGSLSKTISADLRVGYIAASPALVASLTDLKLITSTSTPATVERVVYQVLTSGSYRRHLKQLQQRLDGLRRDVVAQFALRGIQPWYLPEAGFALWLRLPAGISSRALTAYAAAKQVVLAPGPNFSQWPDADQFMRVNITQCADPRLWQVLDDALASLGNTLRG